MIWHGKLWTQRMMVRDTDIWFSKYCGRELKKESTQEGQTEGRVGCLDRTKRKITKIRTRDRSEGQKWKTTQEGSANVYWEHLLHIILKRDSINPTLHHTIPLQTDGIHHFPWRRKKNKQTEYKQKSTIWSRSASDCFIAFTEPYLQFRFVP